MFIILHKLTLTPLKLPYLNVQIIATSGCGSVFLCMHEEMFENLYRINFVFRYFRDETSGLARPLMHMSHGQHQ